MDTSADEVYCSGGGGEDGAPDEGVRGVDMRIFEEGEETHDTKEEGYQLISTVKSQDL